METRANYVIVGIFTLATVVAAFLFVYWTSGIGDRGNVAELRFRIPGSASGLARGSVVLFNGIKVGDIRRVYIDVSNPSVAIADALVDRVTPITKSTTADLGLAGLTGSANIELRGGNPAEPNLFDLAEAEGTVAEMTANPSAVTNLLESAQNIFSRADSVLGQLEGFVGDARGPLTETLRNVEQFSEALGRNAEGIDTFLSSVTQMSQTLAEVSGKLESSLSSVEELILAVDPEKVSATVTNIEQLTRKLDDASDGVGEIMAGVDEAVTSITTFSASANETLARIDGIVENVDKVVAGVDPAAIRTAVTNFEQASAGVNAAVSDVSKVTQTFGARSGDIEKIITDAQQLTERLNQASARVDGVLARVDEQIIPGVDEAVASITRFSNSANDTIARVDNIVGNVDEVVAGVDPAAVRNALTNFEQASASVNAAVNDVSKVTQTFGARAQDIDKIITDAQQLAERLNQASARVDGVLARVDGLLGSGEAEGVMAEASETLKAFRSVADTLNARMGTITDGLARFSGQGLRDVEALVRDSRRSITRIEQAITDLERNPQRILSGGDGAVRQYDGRARR